MRDFDFKTVEGDFMLNKLLSNTIINFNQVHSTLYFEPIKIGILAITKWLNMACFHVQILSKCFKISLRVYTYTTDLSHAQATSVTTAVTADSTIIPTCYCIWHLDATDCDEKANVRELHISYNVRGIYHGIF